MQSISKLLANGPTFVILYIIFMIPTYLLPYVGSNSGLMNTTGVAAGIGVNPAFWLHLISLIVLVTLAYLRGSLVGKVWLVIFPILAACFDLLPGLNFVPFIPTVLHVVVIILGVASPTKAATVS